MSHISLNAQQRDQLNEVLSALEANESIFPVDTIKFCVQENFADGHSSTTLTYESKEHWPATSQLPSQPIKVTLTIIIDPDGVVSVPYREDY